MKIQERTLEVTKLGERVAARTSCSVEQFLKNQWRQKMILWAFPFSLLVVLAFIFLSLVQLTFHRSLS